MVKITALKLDQIFHILLGVFFIFLELIFDGVSDLILESNPLSLLPVFFLHFAVYVLGASFLDSLLPSIAFISARIVSLRTLSILN